MTASKATEYLAIVLAAHPRLRPGVFGQAVQLGREALNELQKLRNSGILGAYKLLPGEDPQ